MADLNKFMAIGRIAADPEIINTQGGSKIFKARFATLGSRKKNEQTGQWDKVSTFVDLVVFNRQNGQKLADFCEQYVFKGGEIYIEGRLILDQWTAQNGDKRSKHLIEVDQVQLLGGKRDGDAARSSAPSRQEERRPGERPPSEDEDVPF